MSTEDTPPVATVNFAKHANGKPVTVEAFFTAKLGVNIGKRLYKELVAFAEDATQSIPGEAAAVFDEKHGRIIAISLPNE